MGNFGGALTKNLLLKVCVCWQLMDVLVIGIPIDAYSCIDMSGGFQDKKHRLYIVSTLADTKVDMKSR